MVLYNDDREVFKSPNRFGVPQDTQFQLILVTHDESTFYKNDCCKTLWQHTTHAPTPEQKGERESLMVLDFLTPKWGHLKNVNECITSHFSVKHSQMIFSEAHVLF